MKDTDDVSWDERFIAQPRLSEDKSSFIWENIRLKTTHKGKGCFAENDIRPGLNVPYGGLNEAHDRVEIIKKNPSRHGGRFLINGLAAEDGKFFHCRNADPSLYEDNMSMPSNAWIGSLMNEASEGEAVNSRLVVFDESSDCPTYPFIEDLDDTKVYVEVFKFVAAGEELLVDYGWSNNLRTRMGYSTSSIKSIRGAPHNVTESYHESQQKNAATMNAKVSAKKRKAKEWKASMEEAKR